MWVNKVVLFAALATTGVILHGCGDAPPTDMVLALCRDATAKAVEATDLVHEHLTEIEDTCKKLKEPEVKPCEDGKVAGIDRAEENISSFYTDHCVEHVNEWLEDANETKTLENVHKHVDQFESTHKDEIKEELHDGIDIAIEEGKSGSKTTLEIVCIHEVEKEVEHDGGLVHDHLKEVEDGCKEDVACGEDAVASIMGAKDKITSSYQDHCKDTNSWSLWAIHPAVDNFASVHKDEIKKTLHAQIDEGMNSTEGNVAPEDLIKFLCSDATAKSVNGQKDMVHEHLDEIQDACKKLEEPEVKPCEDGKVAGIDAALKNVTTFYKEHCVEHVTEWLGEEEKTVKSLHKFVDKFEDTHKDEIKEELHKGIDQGIEEGQAGDKSMLEILCTDEVAKQIENDEGLVHEHLKEVEDTCEGGFEKCGVAAYNIVSAKQLIISQYTQHCMDPTSWSLWAIHPAVDNFATVHKDEISKALHEEIHTAMSTVGLNSTTAAFLMPHAPVARASSSPLGATSAPLLMAAAGCAVIVGSVGLGVARLARQQVSDNSLDQQPMLPMLPEQ